MARCKATTKSGSQCANQAINGTEYCHVGSHSPEGSNKIKRALNSIFAKVFGVIFVIAAVAQFSGYSFKDIIKPEYNLTVKVGNIETSNNDEINLLYNLKGNNYASYVTIPMVVENSTDRTAFNVEVNYKYLGSIDSLKPLPQDKSNKKIGVGGFRSIVKSRETNSTSNVSSSTVILSKVNPEVAYSYQEPIIFTKNYFSSYTDEYNAPNIPVLVTISADDFKPIRIKLWLKGYANKQPFFVLDDNYEKRRTLLITHKGTLHIINNQKAFFSNKLDGINYKEITFKSKI